MGGRQTRFDSLPFPTDSWGGSHAVIVKPTDLAQVVAEFVPTGTFVVTSAHDGKRAGVLARSVAPCATEPILIMLAMRKGHSIAPLIRDSRHFGLCRVDPAERLLMRKFNDADSGPDLADENAGDPFDSIAVESIQSGSPILKRCIFALDCEVVRHFDLEADHEIYVAQVHAAKVPSHAGVIWGEERK